MSQTYKQFTGAARLAWRAREAARQRAYRLRYGDGGRKIKRDYMRAWRARNQERLRTIRIASYIRRKAAGLIRRSPMTSEQRERAKIYHREYAKAHRQEFRDYAREAYRKWRAVTPHMKLGRKPLPVEVKRARQKVSRQAYYHKNKAAINARTTAYRKRNPEVARAAIRKWAANNRHKIRPAKRAREKARRLNDPLYRFIRHLRIEIPKRLRAYGARKSGKTCEMLGCDAATFVKFIESQFTTGMTWENRHEWHVDHVIPLKAFDLSDSEQQRTAFHFSNMRPVWKMVNLKKGARIEADTIASHMPRFAHAALIAKATAMIGGQA